MSNEVSHRCSPYCQNFDVPPKAGAKPNCVVEVKACHAFSAMPALKRRGFGLNELFSPTHAAASCHFVSGKMRSLSILYWASTTSWLGSWPACSSTTMAFCGAFRLL